METEQVNYGGWPNCVRLSNGQVELIATTDVGPRIIRFGFIGEPNLFKEFPGQIGTTGGSDWKPYGGHRLWHAPEVMPRTYAPDNSAIGSDWSAGTLRLIQPVEVETGIQKEMAITLDADSNRVTVIHRLLNKNAWAIEAAPWALTVMRGPGRAIFPHEPPGNELLPARPLALWGYTRMNDPRWIWGDKYIQLRCDPSAATPQKAGMMNKRGWAAYWRDGVLMIKRFDFDPAAAYPDFGCNCEAYTNGDMLEVESLGPLARIQPGATVEHIERWHLFKCDLTENEEEIGRALPPLVQKTAGPWDH